MKYLDISGPLLDRKGQPIHPTRQLPDGQLMVDRSTGALTVERTFLAALENVPAAALPDLKATRRILKLADGLDAAGQNGGVWEVEDADWGYLLIALEQARQAGNGVTVMARLQERVDAVSDVKPTPVATESPGGEA